MRDFALEVYFSQWEFTARYNMAASAAESMALHELLALASAEDREAYQHVSLGYTETFGAPALREVIASTYEAVDAAHVLCFAGAEEAIYVAMHVLLAAGDHAIVVTPGYQASETIPLSLCAVTGVPLHPERNWELDLDELRAAIQPNTKLIAINFPNNPTGKIISQATYTALIELCRQRGIWLLSDEVYRLMERDITLRLPQAVDRYERGISLNVMSKAYGLAGLRIGWLACHDRELLVRCERYKHYLSICNSAPSEVLARIALQAREQILARNMAIVRANLVELRSFFGDYPQLFDWQEPDGGCVAFIRYTGSEGVERFTQQLVEQSGVLFLPASLYRSELNPVPADYLRVGFGQSHFPAGLAALREWMQQNPRSPV